MRTPGPTLVLALALALGACKPHGTVPYGDSRVEWGGGATEPEARALGDFLRDAQYLGQPGMKVTVKLDREKEMSHSPPTYRVTYVVKDGAWNDEATVGFIQNLTDDMKRRVFRGEQTIAVLADDPRGDEKKKLYGR
jgi:hypothetical protein